MMKASFRLIFAALAATAALISCTKEPTPGQTDQTPAAPVTEGTRVIAVSFAPQTKTALGSDGLTPNFTKDDKILLITVPETQGAKVDTQTVAVSVDPKTGDATVTTKLSGNLKALYPAHLANYAKEMFDIRVPAEQSGEFKDANICQAEISSDSKAAALTNKYALFKIKSPDASQKLTVKSLPAIGADGQRTGNRQHINGDGLYSVTVSTPILAMPDSIYYVALNPGVKLSDLSFEVEFWDEGTGSIKGIPTSKIKAQADNLQKEYGKYNAVAIGTAYTIDDSNWHEYVEINGLKWATRNIGATTDTGTDSYGYHFFWGGPEGYKHINDGENSRWVKTSDNTVLPGGFISTNTPYYENSIYIKYTGTGGDDKTILDLADDAANANWGGAWRMPTGGEDGEFKALYEATTWTAEDSGYYVTKKNESLESDKSNALLFFPAAWMGDGNALVNSDNGYYLSNTLHISNSNHEYILHIFMSEADPQSSHTRQEGCSVRAIIDEPAAENQEDAQGD